MFCCFKDQWSSFIPTGNVSYRCYVGDNNKSDYRMFFLFGTLTNILCFIRALQLILLTDNTLTVGAARQRDRRLVGDKRKSLQRNRLFPFSSRRAGGTEKGHR